MEATRRLKSKRSQRNKIQEAHTCSCHYKKLSRLLSICSYAHRRDADGLLLLFIGLGLLKASRFQERFETMFLASIPRPSNANGKSRLAQEQLLSSIYLLVVEIK